MATLGVAEITRARPMTGATAMRAPTISSSVAPAAMADSTLLWNDTGAAPSATRAPRRTRACVLGSSPDASILSRRVANSDSMTSSSWIPRRRSLSSSSATITFSVRRALARGPRIARRRNDTAPARRRHHPDSMKDRQRWGSVSLDQQAEVLGALDRLAARRHAELAVDRDRLRLDGVRRQVQALADLAERVVGGQQREEPQLRRRERRRPDDVGAHGLQLRSQLVGLLPEDAEVRLPSEQVVDLPEHAPGAGHVREGDVGAHELQPRLDGVELHGVRHLS